jgi:alanine racemase
MKMHTIFQIAVQIRATWLQQEQDAPIEHILIDSRKLIFPATSLFFALSGPRRNGNLFIDELYQKAFLIFVLLQLLPGE